jgi:putative DNA primase/helicase
MATNGFPKVSDESDAVWNRIVLLVYPNRIREENMDPFLQDKLAAERQGILSWAMNIFAEEYKRDRCRSVMKVDIHGAKEMTRWRKINNPALEWLKDRVEHTLDPEDRLTCDQAYADYKVWVRKEGHRQAAKNHFARVVSPQLRQVRDANGKAVYIGVKLEPLPYFGNNAEIN